jgi:hypothetical protein
VNNVEYVRPEVKLYLDRWSKIRDVIEGEEAVKGAGSRYLPPLNPTDPSPENIARNEQYIFRAYWFGGTARTLEGLIGISFHKEPVVEIPTSMDVLKTDVDGGGTNLLGQAHQTLEATLELGRCGLFTDYPTREDGVSVADAGEIHASIMLYQAEQITNWRIGPDHKLSLVVLFEQVDEEDDYETTKTDQWRELRMEEIEGLGRVYTMRVWQRKRNSKGQQTGDLEMTTDEPVIPRQGNGQPWGFIPFTFVGAIDNNSEIDKSPILDLVNVNLAHYRSGANHFDGEYFINQPQIWVTGADEHWVKMMKDQGIYFGSRAVGPAPVGDMVSLGARLITPGGAPITAEQSRSDTAANHSVVSLVAANVSDAYTQSLTWAAMFMNLSGDTLFVLNTDFVGLLFDANQVNAVVKSWQSGAIPTSDKNDALKQYGLIDATKSDDEIENEISAEGGGLNLTDPALEPPPATEEPPPDE